MRKLITYHSSLIALVLLALCAVMVMAQQSTKPTETKPAAQATPAPAPTPEVKPLTADEFQQAVDADRMILLRQTELAAAQARVDAANAQWRALLDRLKLDHDCRNCSLAQDGKSLVKPAPTPAPPEKK